MTVTDIRQAGSTMQDSLAAMIDRRTQGLTDCESGIAGLTFFRRNAPASPTICMVEANVILVVQGSKQMWVGGSGYPYDSNNFLITSLDLPANSEVVEASAAQPCLGLSLKLDLSLISELMTQSQLEAAHKQGPEQGIGIGTVTPEIQEPFRRLVSLLDEPEASDVLAPLIIREIHYRLLTSDQAPRLLHAASVGSQSQRIARAIDWLKLHYQEALAVDELAAHVQMSSSSFYQHFRQLTGMSPLQYQKWLRLNEARRLMLTDHLDAAESAYRVGYDSPSQFSREYRRLFGLPPKRDIENLRTA
ncbi:MAG: AraC family transcriptional regulator [Oceanospirillaceae bacterium]|nr:AraC family transcriptional regulator [Oceanospirillaceae bacterium]MBT13853.1 AraC family transcriptional regulator [Oceanospirillaceae bacterium]